jgi:hypothetical protein
MKIIKTSKDISTKIECGLNFLDYKTLFERYIKQDANLNDPFLAIKQRSQLDLNLLKLCYKKRYIGIVDYIFSLFYLKIYTVLNIPKSFFSSSLRHCKFSNEVVPGKYKAITCTNGIARAKVNLLNEDQYYDIPLVEASKNLRVHERIGTLLIMMSYKVSSYQHAAQFFILKKNIPKITASLLVIEEGVDFPVQCFVFLLRPKVAKTMLTLRGPSMFAGMKYNHDSVVVNNRITYDQLAHKNSNVSIENFPPDFNIFLYKNNREKLIGYAPDISNPILSHYKKNAMDKLFFHKIKGQDVHLTIHPLDNIKDYSDYLKYKNVTLRGDENIETYFSKIDILVTWWSTLIFQAVYCGTPVIVLDLFDDGHSDHVSNLTDNFVRTVKSISELNIAINEFRNYSSDEKKLKQKNALKNIYPMAKHSTDLFY